MANLIGVYHTDRNLEKLIEYVSDNYGVPSSMMLEIPPYWREVIDKPLGRNNNYFFHLAKQFEDKGSRIIAGDKNFGVIISKDLYNKLNEVFSEGAKTFRGKVNLITRRLFLGLKAKIIVETNLNNPKKSLFRNQGFLEIFEEEKPELTIIGDSHAQYIKKFYPNLDYTRFRSNTLLETLYSYGDISIFSNNLMSPEKEIVIGL